MLNDVSISPYENLPIGVYTCDSNGYLTSCNESAIALWGRRPELGAEKWSGALKVFGDGDYLLSSDEYPVAVAVRERKIIPNAEYIIEQPDGKKRNVMLCSIPTFNDLGQFTGTINTLLDITDEKANEVRQVMMASIIESSDDAIISKTLDGIITSWNQGAETLFGYSEAEALGRHISLIIPKEKFEEEKFIIDKMSRGEKIEHFESWRVNRDGKQIPVSLTISPVKDVKGVIVGASKIARDITRQRSADDQLKRYASQLEKEVEARTQMLSDTIVSLEETRESLNKALVNEKKLGQLKSRFVSMASHEFRTPLSSIKLSSSLIEKYANNYDKDNVNKHIGKIKNAVTNLTTILDDFLSLEKLETGKIKVDFVEFDIIKFFEEIRDDMQILAKPTQVIAYEHTGTTASVKLDPNLLHNCLINLISNAIKYSPEDSMIELNTEINDKEFLVIVQDHGIGIPDNEQNHLFEAFFRANNTGAVQGTGLGLNIVSRYTNLMNGAISFESVSGKGSRFTLKFSSIT